MFAVFYKNDFVDWWLNRPSDETWIERTIKAKGWNANDVKVYWFDQPPRESIHQFNADFSISIMRQVTVQVPVQIEIEGEMQTQLQDKQAWEVQETRLGSLYYEAGQKVG